MYREAVEERLGDTGGVSPVSIRSTVSVRGDSVAMAATFRLVDPVVLDHLRATLLIFENGVHGPTDPFGHTIYNGVTRRIYDRPIMLTAVNDTATVATTLPIGSGWNADSLRAVAYLQRTDTKEIIQGHVLELDFFASFAKRVRSVPNGNGVAIFPASITCTSNHAETLRLQPWRPFGNWAVDYLVCGDPNPKIGMTEITLSPNETCEIYVRVHTNDDVIRRTGSFKVTDVATGHAQETSLSVWNANPSILLVENDGSNGAGAAAVVNAIDAGGHPHDDHNVDLQGLPVSRTMESYDIVIWEASRHLDPDSVATGRLMTYLDQGGALFLTSSGYLNTLPANGDTFSRQYLGVDSFDLDLGYRTMYGYWGDPIGDGLTLPLHFQYPSFYKGDETYPTASAYPVLYDDIGPFPMIRNVTSSGAKTVFLAEAFEGISQTDPDPNNAKVLLTRTIDWLKSAQAADARPVSAPAGLGITEIRPNPFNATTSVRFILSPRAAQGRVRLDVFDLMGRHVAALFEGSLSPGEHMVPWDGRSEVGPKAGSGIYLARLTTCNGSVSRKVVLLK